ncbi:hypothetical protein ABZR34_31205 [Pseudomonas paraeruginosa]|uniref:hypothetical protein n=1 Tax=Pseudomonas paraeruginosa TaxID=2994495 RepID=UPI0034586DA2
MTHSLKIALAAAMVFAGTVTSAMGVEKIKITPIAVIEFPNHSVGSVLKVCIDGQVYLITDSSNGTSGITPALDNGLPARCSLEGSGNTPNTHP